jgi:hypothetical protein
LTENSSMLDNSPLKLFIVFLFLLLFNVSIFSVFLFDGSNISSHARHQCSNDVSSDIYFQKCNYHESASEKTHIIQLGLKERERLLNGTLPYGLLYINKDEVFLFKDSYEKSVGDDNGYSCYTTVKGQIHLRLLNNFDTLDKDKCFIIWQKIKVIN